MSVLLIDIGNTRIKWKLAGSPVLCSGNVAHGTQASSDWIKKLSDFETTLPKEFEIVCVATVADVPEIYKACRQVWGGRLMWLEHPFPDHELFIHCYSRPERLGVDRWLSMIGARRCCKNNLIVVDAGTALKIDLFSAENRHVGGFIVPGSQVARQSLWQNTDKVISYSDEVADESLAPGQSTVACVNAGIRRQALELVRSVKNEYPDFSVVVTGGDGDWLSRKIDCVYQPELVFKGMEGVCAGSL